MGFDELLNSISEAVTPLLDMIFELFAKHWFLIIVIGLVGIIASCTGFMGL